MQVDNEIEKRVIETIDVDGMLRFLCALVGIRSLDGEETEVQERVAAQLQDCGLDLDTWELDFDELSKHPAYCVEVERSVGLGVVGLLGEDRGGRSLIYNGHTDVVPAGNESNWTYPAWKGTLDNDRVYGRGSVDMKGGLSCAIFAAKAIRDAGVGLDGRLIIESVIGEEDGGVGTLATILRGYQADGAVVVEPTELCIAPAQAGALNFRLTVPGSSAHGCIREEGVSAIEKFYPLLEALTQLEEQRNTQRPRHSLFGRYRLPYALCIGTLRAGNWASSVAESLVCEGRYGVAVGEEIETARRAFEETLATAYSADEWLRQHPPVLEWWGGQFAPAEIAPDHPIVKTVSDAYTKVCGELARIEGMTYGADMRLLVNEGNTPAVLFGPGDVRRSHRPDEYVPVEDLVTTVQTLALTALRFCGHDR